MDEHALSLALVDVARASTRDLSVQQMLDYLTARVLDVVALAGVSALLVDADGDSARQAATHEVLAGLVTLELELGAGPSLAAHRTGRDVTIASTAHDERFPHFSAAAAGAGVGAAFGFPLQVDGARLGGFTLYAADAGTLSAADRTDVHMLGDVLAAFLYNAQARLRSREAVEVLRDRALHDPVTGAPNRWLLRDRLGHAVERSRRGGTHVAVLFVDVDRMKLINDRHGHAAGDTFLRLLVDRISSVLRPEDTLARLAGDEFVVICEELSEVAQAEEVADRVLGALRTPFALGPSAGVAPSVSIGIAIAGHGPGAGDEALARADVAMYDAKRHGGASRRTARPVAAAVRPYAVPDVG